MTLSPRSPALFGTLRFPYVHSGTVAPVLIVVAILWMASSWCYYAFVEALQLDSGYEDSPILFAGFYLLWSSVALALFHPLLSVHSTPRRIIGHIIALAPVMLIYAFYVTVILPLLPEISVLRAPSDPPEFMFASAWYYLPKSADILFQQILVAAMVLGAHRAKIALPVISLGMAALFGGFHLLLILDGFTSFYVARFTLAASVFGLVIPYLYLRTRNGFRWAYGLHWSFYAIDAAVTHFVLAVPPWAT